MKKFLMALLIVCVVCSSAFASTSQTLLSAVTATGASSAVATGDMETKTVYIITTDATTGGTVAVQTSYDNTTWVTIASEAVTNGITEIAIVGLFQKYIRANITARTDGTYSVYLFGKQ